MLYLTTEMTDIQIAAEMGFTIRTLTRLKRDPEFIEALKAAKRQVQTELVRFPVARKIVRMQALNEQYQRIRSLFEARSAVDGDAPGIETGLLWADTKIAGNGTAVDVWGFDAALHREYRETLKQAAIEAGEWDEKNNVPDDGTLPDGSSIRRIVIEEVRYGDGAAESTHTVGSESGYVALPLPLRANADMGSA